MEDYQRIDFTLLFLTLMLAGIGLVMVYSSSMYLSLDETGSPFYYVMKQSRHLVVGFLFMMFLTRVNYRGYNGIRTVLMGAGFTLLIWLLIQNHLRGYSVNRWLRIGPLVFQPSEPMKLILIVFLAGAIASMGDRVRSFKEGFLPLLGIVGATFALVFLQPDLGISGLMLAIGFYLLFIGRAKMTHLMAVILPAAGVVALLVTQVSYMRQRWEAFISAEAAYQIKQSIISIGSGGVLGVGLGSSTQKYHFLPEMYTDFVFSIYAEELGFVGVIVLLGLTLAFVWRGMRVARLAPDLFGFLLASGLTMLIAMQIIINLGVAVRLLPTTGMTLPFISYGGTSLVTSFMAVGILLNISKQGNYELRLSREFGKRSYRKVWS